MVSMSALIVVARFSLPYEAQIRASLDAAGIPAFIADEHTINMNWLYPMRSVACA